MLKTRVISACVFVPVMLGATFLGGPVFVLLMAFVAALGCYEYGRMLETVQADTRFPLWLTAPAAVVLMVAVWLLPQPAIAALLVAFLTLLVLLLLFVGDRLTAAESASAFLGFCYIALPIAAMVAVRLHFADGLVFVLLIFAIQWLTDCGAYFVGRAIGRHKLAPRVSPNKTIEGALGGVAVAILTAVIFNLITQVLPFGWMILLAIVASVLGQLGDLTESALKRWVGVKDSGKIMPGHGGVLDRFDSLLFIAPVVLFFLAIYMNSL